MFNFTALQETQQKELNQAAMNNKVTFIERECECPVHGKYTAKVYMLGEFEIGHECPKCREEIFITIHNSRKTRELAINFCGRKS